MKKQAAVITGLATQLGSAAAHLTHSQNSMMEPGVHLTTLQTLGLAVLTAVTAGFIVYGLSHATDALPNKGEDEE